jgi:hypothetical protein
MAHVQVMGLAPLSRGGSGAMVDVLGVVVGAIRWREVLNR